MNLSPSSTSKLPVRNRKARAVGTAGRRSVGRHRRTRTRPQISVSKIDSQPEPHFDFSRNEEESGEVELEDQVWLSNFHFYVGLTAYGIDGLVRR